MKKDYKFINFYDKIKKDDNKLTNPNFDIHKINVPFRMLIVGASGSGKTNTALNIIQAMSNTFSSIDIITKNADEKLYNYLKQKIKKNLNIYEGVSKIPNVDSYDKSSNHLIIFDDLMLDKMDKICDFYIRSRKMSCSCMFLTQSYIGNGTKEFRTIRKNCDYIILKKINGVNDLKLINREYSLGVDNETFLNMYNQIINEDFNNFLMIDCEKGSDERFRKNFICM